MVEVRLIERQTDLVSIEDEWLRLWMSTRPANVFTSVPWARSFFSSHADIGKPCVMTVRQDGALIGVLPLFSQNGQLTFAGAGFADYNDILMHPDTAPEAMEKVADLLCTMSRDWKRVVLPSMRENSLLMTLCQSIRRRMGMKCQLGRVHRCLSAVDDGTSFQRCRDQENARRCERRLEKAGPVSFRHLSTREEIRAELDAFFEHHAYRRAVATDSAGQLRTEEARRFIRELVSAVDPAAGLRFAVLCVANDPVAWHLGFEVDDRYLWYLPGFNIDYWNYRPGLIIIRHVFAHAMMQKLSEVDFTIGDEAYKYRYANRFTWNFNCTIDDSALRTVARNCRRSLREWQRSKRRGRSQGAATSPLSSEVQRLPGSDVRSPAATKRRWGAAGLCAVSILQMNDRAGARERDTAGENRMTLTPARLSDMVRFWLEHKGVVRPTDAVELWKRNGRAYILCLNGKVIASAWVVGPSAALEAEAPAEWIARNAVDGDMILYPYHLAEGFDNAEAGDYLLSSLREAMRDLGIRRLWTWSSVMDSRRRLNLTRNGFRRHSLVFGLGPFMMPVRWKSSLPVVPA